MSTSIVIPKTIEAAKAGLGGIEALLTAKQWERAAIVYAFTAPAQGARTDLGGNPPKLSVAAFTSLGITGLRDHNQVRLYRKAWESAMEAGAPDVKPGDTITLPNLPWKDHFGEPTANVQERTARAYIARNPQVAVEAIKAVPAVAEAVVAAVVDDHDLAEKHARMTFAKTTSGKTVDRGPATPVSTVPNYDYENRVRDAVRTINTAIENAKTGAWNPDGMMLGLLTVFHLQLKGWVDGIAATQPAIHDEIDQFLAASRKVE